MAQAVAEEIDENLHSRSLAVYGRESMRRLRHAHVLMVGSDGLLAETAKNVILANVRAVELHDLGAVVTPGHLSSHFYLKEGDVGKPVAAVLQPRLQELNDSVSVSVAEELPLEKIGRSITAVVCIGVPLDVALRLSQACRACSPQVPFMRACVRGLYGKVVSGKYF